MSIAKSPPTQAELDEVLALVRASRHASAMGRVLRWPDVWADRVRLMVLYREGHHERAAELALAVAERGWLDASVAAVIALAARDPKHREAARALIESALTPASVAVPDLVGGDLGAWARYVRGMVQTNQSANAVAAVTLAMGAGMMGPELWALLAGELIAVGDIALARHVLSEGLMHFPGQPDLGDALSLLEARRAEA